MPQRTCGTSGCPNVHRAKGLCSSCYNRQHQSDRHPKRIIACSVCGQPALKASSKRYRPVCSMYCRWFLQNPVLSCTIPRSHPAHPDYSPPAPRRLRRSAAELVSLLQPRPCADCAETFEPVTTRQRFCARRCKTRVKRRMRIAREHEAQGSFTWAQVIGLFLLFDRRCAYCEQPVNGEPDPDHVVPLSRHGHNGISNVLPACRLCNSDKRDLLLTEWNTDRRRRGLPPRITAWSPFDSRIQHLSPGIAPPVITLSQVG